MSKFEEWLDKKYGASDPERYHGYGEYDMKQAWDAALEEKIAVKKEIINQLGWRLHNNGKITKEDWMEIVVNETCI